MHIRRISHRQGFGLLFVKWIGIVKSFLNWQTPKCTVTVPIYTTCTIQLTEWTNASNQYLTIHERSRAWSTLLNYSLSKRDLMWCNVVIVVSSLSPAWSRKCVGKGRSCRSSDGILCTSRPRARSSLWRGRRFEVPARTRNWTESPEIK